MSKNDKKFKTDVIYNWTWEDINDLNLIGKYDLWVKEKEKRDKINKNNLQQTQNNP